MSIHIPHSTRSGFKPPFVLEITVTVPYFLEKFRGSPRDIYIPRCVGVDDLDVGKWVVLELVLQFGFLIT